MSDFGEYEQNYHIKHIDCSSFDAESTASFKLDNRWGKPIPEGTVQHVIIITEKECTYYPLTEKVLVSHKCPSLQQNFYRNWFVTEILQKFVCNRNLTGVIFDRKVTGVPI